MTNEIPEIVEKIRALEDDLEEGMEDRRRRFAYRLERGRVVFEQEVREQHRKLRTSLGRFWADARLVNFVAGPIVYALILPLCLLDLSVTLYQHICFRLWSIPRVTRSKFIVLDRHRLGYLNAIEKLNCVYCGYANGLIAYTREVASRTEQYWCPIKHALKVRGAHRRYLDFTDYGDAEGLRGNWERYRETLAKAHAPDDDERPT